MFTTLRCDGAPKRAAVTDADNVLMSLYGSPQPVALTDAVGHPLGRCGVGLTVAVAPRYWLTCDRVAVSRICQNGGGSGSVSAVRASSLAGGGWVVAALCGLAGGG
jgi:hypothetical protein